MPTYGGLLYSGCDLFSVLIAGKEFQRFFFNFQWLEKLTLTVLSKRIATQWGPNYPGINQKSVITIKISLRAIRSRRAFPARIAKMGRVHCTKSLSEFLLVQNQHIIVYRIYLPVGKIEQIRFSYTAEKSFLNHVNLTEILSVITQAPNGILFRAKSVGKV